MGNPNLVIVINDWYALIVTGDKYDTREEAINNTITSYWARYKLLLSENDCDPDFDWDIKKIAIFDIASESER